MSWGEHIPYRTARLNMRVTEDGLALLKLAARLREQDVTSLVLGAAMAHARQVVAKDGAIYATGELDVDEAMDAADGYGPEELLRELRRVAAERREEAARWDPARWTAEAGDAAE